MRPIIRGNVPQDATTKSPIKFTDHKEARPHLIENIGSYCSYCERRLDTGLDVEHIKYKDKHKRLKLRWENFLLSCKNCNSCKSTNDVKLYDYYWCYRDNTALAFEYLEGGIIKENSKLTPEQQTRAKNTINLTRLDRRPGHQGYKGNDVLWNQRREVWDIAQDSLKDLNAQDTEGLRRSIVNIAKGRGFWSIWMTVFRDDKDMLKRFVEDFPGTCQECFDENFNPVHRPGGAL